jgi:protein SCO1/2
VTRQTHSTPGARGAQSGLLTNGLSASVWLVVCSLLVVAAPTAIRAQMAGAPSAGYKREAGMPASTMPPALREIGFDQNIDQLLPLDIPFADEHGRVAPLASYFGTRPVVLVFVYYECPMLCTTVLNALAGSLNVMSLEPGKDFDIVTISFDPRETPALAAAKKETYLQRYKRPGAAAGWHFLTGTQSSIDRAAKAAGFRFVWDDGLKQFAHPTGIIVLTPEGRIARYLFGIDYGPRDLRLALVDASAGKVGSTVDAFLLYCYHYDPMTGRYGVAIMRAIRVAGSATVISLGLFIGIMVRRERRAQRVRRPVLSTRHGLAK